MKQLIIFLFVFVSAINAQEWKNYYNRIPVWPSSLTLENVDAYISSLDNLKTEIESSKPDYMEQMQNMSQAEAMKLAMEFQKNAANMSPQEIQRRIQLADSFTSVELPKEMELQTKLSQVIKEFEEKIFAEVGNIRAKYPCEMGIESSTDRCEERGSALKSLGAKLGNEYFLGSNAKIKVVIDAILDFRIKEVIPLNVQREKDQMKAMGKNVSGDLSALGIVSGCIDQLKVAAEKMMWIAGLMQDDNWHYNPGFEF